MTPTTSFKDFVTQFVKQPLPTTMATVATAIGFDKRPISLRAMMATAAPYVPDLTWAPFVDNSQSTPPNWQLIFSWTDDANLPPWDYESSSWSGPPPNKARAATSWQFTVWPPGGSPCIDATVTVANENTVGGVQYTFNGELVGDFDYQITAFNNYGSSTTGRQPLTIALGSAMPAPVAGLSGQSNYILYNNCDPLTGLKVTVNVTQDIVCQSASGPITGFSIQLNGISPTSATTSGQQYCITFSNNEIAAVVNNWSGVGSSSKLIIDDSVGLVSLSASGIPAGYKLGISLQNDSNHNISGATFTVIDEHGNMLKSYPLGLETYGATAIELAPIVAFQLNLVGPGNGETVVLSSGSGSIVYEATGGLTVTNSWPCGVAGGTKENANSTYGALTSGPGSLFSQSFNVGA